MPPFLKGQTRFSKFSSGNPNGGWGKHGIFLHFKPPNVKNPPKIVIFKSCQILLKICTLKISTVLWIHFWCYFDPKNLLWPPGGILTPQNVKKHPMIFRRCLILLKFCTKLLTLSREPIILGLVDMETTFVVFFEKIIVYMPGKFWDDQNLAIGVKICPFSP